MATPEEREQEYRDERRRLIVDAKYGEPEDDCWCEDYCLECGEQSEDCVCV